MADVKKYAGLEETGISDSETGRSIRISTTTRKMFRYVFRNEVELGYDKMRNEQLNQIIAEKFIDSSDKIVHHFKLESYDAESQEQNIAEIRNWSGTAMFFISTVRQGNIDILTLQPAYKPPKYKASKE